MAFTLLQVAKSLKSVNASGQLSSALTLPTGITLRSDRVPRFARYKQYVIVVNTPSRPLLIDTDGVVYPLTPLAPASAVILSSGTAGTLTGSYLALQTYKIRDSLGNVITESDYGPLMTARVAIVAKHLAAAFAASLDPQVNATQLYRTTTDGGVYFPWALIDSHSTTSYEDQVADAALGIIERPLRGSAPDLTLIAEWAGRLWGVDRTDVDDVRYTEAGTAFAWAALNTLSIPHIGSDAAGVMALVPRRNSLGVARLDTFAQITGTDRTNFRPTTIPGGEQCGCVAPESVVIFNDVAYFLWRDGVYRWDDNGIATISNGQVRSWFTTGTYFNQALFYKAFAQLDIQRLKYRLFLASADSTVINRWIEFDLLTQAWFGPHQTEAFLPTCAVQVAGSNQQGYGMIGSDEGFLSIDGEGKRDWLSSPINLSVKTRGFSMQDPDHDKYFGELSVTMIRQSAGSMTVTPSVGEVNAEVAKTPFTCAMTAVRQRLGRIGTGKSMTLQFDHHTIDEDVIVLGYEIDPVTMIGRR